MPKVKDKRKYICVTETPKGADKDGMINRGRGVREGKHIHVFPKDYEDSDISVEIIDFEEK